MVVVLVVWEDAALLNFVGIQLNSMLYAVHLVWLLLCMSVQSSHAPSHVQTQPCS